MRTTIRTSHVDAPTVAAAVIPDNTTEIETRIEDGTVVTTIEREATSGLRSTVDDYVVNVGVADAVAEHARTTDASIEGTPKSVETVEESNETTDTNTRTNTNTQ